MKRLLIITHSPSPNTQALREAVIEGAQGEGVEVVSQTPFETEAEHVLSAQGIILGTPENLGYMSGALKDFFDRIYYPCLEQTQGLPYALYIRAGQDGTGTKKAVKTITTGLRWRPVQDPLVCRGEFSPRFIQDCKDLGMAMAAGLEAGVF